MAGAAGPARARRSAELLVVAHRGQWSKVEDLLQMGASANSRGAHRVSVLMLAARQGAAKTVVDLLEHHADPNARDSLGSSALLHGCRSAGAPGAPSAVRALLEGAADLALRDTVGCTALTAAAELGHLAVSRVLLEFRADVNAVVCSERPTARAMGMRSSRVVDTFIQGRGCNPVQDYMKHRRVQELVEEQRAAEEQFLDLDEVCEETSFAEEQEDCQLRASTPSGNFRLVQSLGFDRDSSAVDSFEQEVYGTGKYFMSRNAALRPQDLARPLPTGTDLEAREASSKVLRGTEPKFDGSHATALVIAARAGHSDLCELLLQHLADASAVDGNNETALEVAAHNGHYVTCEVLLSGQAPTPQAHGAALVAAEALGLQEIVMLVRDRKSVV